MSDAQVLTAVERMEAWMQAQDPPMDPEALAAWNREFLSALETAERGPGWADLVARAQRLGAELDRRATLLIAEREDLRKALGAQSLGDRALKGYGATAR